MRNITEVVEKRIAEYLKLRLILLGLFSRKLGKRLVKLVYFSILFLK